MKKDKYDMDSFKKDIKMMSNSYQEKIKKNIWKNREKNKWDFNTKDLKKYLKLKNAKKKFLKKMLKKLNNKTYNHKNKNLV